jgi:hypothetical protein
MEPADLLFWCKGPEGQFMVMAATLDDAKRKMARNGKGCTEGGQVGPGDSMPGSSWVELHDEE